MIIHYILSKLAWSAVVAADVALAGRLKFNIAVSRLWSGPRCCPGLGGLCGDVPTAELAPDIIGFPNTLFSQQGQALSFF